MSLQASHAEGLAEGPTEPVATVDAGQVFAPPVSRPVGAKLDLGDLGATPALFQLVRPPDLTDPATDHFGVDGEQRDRGVELTLFGEPRPTCGYWAASCCWTGS